MTNHQAMRLWKQFLFDECEGRETRTAWVRIDGSRICSRCGRDRKKRKLYVYCDPESHIYLHCFRASCDIHRIITVQDFQQFGFTNTEAISVLLDSSNKTQVRLYHSGGNPMVVEDLVPSKEQWDYYYRRVRRELTPREVSEIRFIPNLYRVFQENLDPDDPLWKTIHKSRLNDSKLWFCIANEEWNVFSVRHLTKNIKIILSTAEGVNHGISYLRTEDGVPDTLVLAEGVFDILNAYHHFAYLDNAVYIACIGQDAMLRDIQYYKQKYLDSLQTLILFVDSDIYQAETGTYTFRRKKIEWLIRQVLRKLGKDAFSRIHICWNRKSKDFGDLQQPIEAIREDIKIEDILS